jgi:hypothetical protein
MISKILKARSNFKSIVEYAVKENKNHQVILSNGVRDYDTKKTIADFTLQASNNKNIRKMAFHMVLSHSPKDTEKIKGKEKDILENYLAKLKDGQIDFSNTQYIVYKHADKEHVHYHLLANYVTNDFKRLNDSNIGLKAKAASKALTLELNLTPAIKEKVKQHIELKENKKTRYGRSR